MRGTCWRYIFALSSLVLIAATGPAGAAEIDQGTWVAGALVAVTNYANDSTLDLSVMYGGRGAYYFRAQHGIELDLSFGSTDNDLPGNTSTFDLSKVLVNYVHNFQMKKQTRMMPLLVVGMGKFNIDNGTSSDWATTLQFGAGSRVSISERSALRFDATLLRWRGDGVVTPRGSYFTLEFTAGWSFFIGSGA